ncbi:catalase family protein [Methylorubrum extorquens]|uniref:catalase family protein n=1 Tax=Methylorubrum extorquens TaxID=408 RepID=UPI00016298A1|nr:catalase family protein [Methylorubrum extorquens]ABY31474.1 catalase [Methylorubrum extorquens PA1]KQP86772.1 catalase [Methylobacterium sp. Leaf119]WIU38109.1 catalase family protein [Methylorubrum extorquens]
MISAPIRYHDAIETLSPDENETIDRIIAAMTHESEITAERYGHAVRASHAKISGVTVGALEILPNLPPELAQGLFATPGTHSVIVRFAQGPGELLKDRVSTHRGMAIKVLGVEGDKLPGHEAPTQDFVFATGPVFPNPDAKGFLGSMKQLEAGTSAPEAVKAAVSRSARALDGVVKLVTGESSPLLDFFGHVPHHPLAEPYYSQAALRYGDHVAKLGAFPASPAQAALADARLDTDREDGNVFRHAVLSYLAGSEAVFDIRVQLCLNLDEMPVEDASKRWDEAQSPYRTVARLVLPPQDALSEARRNYADDVLSFRPAHSLTAHRPLGSLMRARLKTYQALSRFRHARNRVPEVEPASIDDVPA